MAENITLEDLAEWEKDFENELSLEFSEFDSVEIVFIDQEHVLDVIRNVEPIILNVEEARAKAGGAQARKKKLPLIKLSKTLQDINCKEKMLQSIGMVVNDKTYFISSPFVLQARKAELQSLKLLSNENFVQVHIRTVLSEIFKILETCQNCTLFSEGKKNIWRSLYQQRHDIIFERLLAPWWIRSSV